MFGAIIECLVFELTACALVVLQAQDTGACYDHCSKQDKDSQDGSICCLPSK
jgi:hypothetical protein